MWRLRSITPSFSAMACSAGCGSASASSRTRGRPLRPLADRFHKALRRSGSLERFSSLSVLRRDRLGVRRDSLARVGEEAGLAPLPALGDEVRWVDQHVALAWQRPNREIGAVFIAGDDPSE